MTDSLFKPVQAPVEEPKPCPVVPLYPDGIFIREAGGVIWVERRRGSASVCCVAYTEDELRGLYERLAARFA